MISLAQRNLLHDTVRLTVTLTGIVFAVVLIVIELGLDVGFTQTTSCLIDHTLLVRKVCRSDAYFWPNHSRPVFTECECPVCTIEH